jgi:hypothetical protein
VGVIKPGFVLCFISLFIGACSSGAAPVSRSVTATMASPPRAVPSPLPIDPEQGCSLIYATDGELMFGGNNEDSLDPLAKVWFIPGEAGSFGRAYFGFEDYHAQGGMNDQGLFFDALSLDEVIPVDGAGKQEYQGNLVDKIMSECATVGCALRIFEQYHRWDVWFWQFFFGDATGESAIVEPQAVIRQQGGYQVATNFLQSITPPEVRSDRRYQTATERLESMDELSVESMRDVLDAVHLNGAASTVYSNVYDLNNKIIYLYYFHNYDDVVVLNLEEELAQGYHTYDLPSLFAPNQQAERWAEPKLRRYHELVESRLATDLDPALLQAYAGDYEMPEGWGAPDERLTVIVQGPSILLRYPDFHQHELFPESATSFYYVAFLGADFALAYEARFGLDEDGRVLYLELLVGDESIRADRLGPESFVPQAPTQGPVATTTPSVTPEPAPTAGPAATPTPSATPASTPTSGPAATPTPSATPESTATAGPAATATSSVTPEEPGQLSPPTVVMEAAPPPEKGTAAGAAGVGLIVLLLIMSAAIGWTAIRKRK